MGDLPGNWGLLVIGNYKGAFICGVVTFPEALPELSSIIYARIDSVISYA